MSARIAPAYSASPPNAILGALDSDRLEKLGVAAVLGERLEQPLHRLDGLEREESAAQLLHLLVLVLAEELLLLARAGGLDVDGREDALLGELAIQVDLGVAGALELLEDHLVHPRARVDQSSGDDGERAALLGVAGRAEQPL